MPQGYASIVDFATPLSETWGYEAWKRAYLTQTSRYHLGYRVYSKPSNKVVRCRPQGFPLYQCARLWYALAPLP
jgi:hypothetical protein